MKGTELARTGGALARIKERASRTRWLAGPARAAAALVWAAASATLFHVAVTGAIPTLAWVYGVAAGVSYDMRPLDLLVSWGIPMLFVAAVTTAAYFVCVRWLWRKTRGWASRWIETRYGTERGDQRAGTR